MRITLERGFPFSDVSSVIVINIDRSTQVDHFRLNTINGPIINRLIINRPIINRPTHKIIFGNIGFNICFCNIYVGLHYPELSIQEVLPVYRPTKYI